MKIKHDKLAINFHLHEKKTSLINQIVLFVSLQYYDLAADVLAENAHLTYKFLTPVSFLILSIMYA